MHQAYLRVCFCRLAGRRHASDEGGASEWPPSPLRAWQALLVAGSALERSGRVTGVVDAVRRMASLEPPVIVVSPSLAGVVIPVVFPDNDGDLAARGRRAPPEERASNCLGAGPVGAGTITYAWPVGPDFDVDGVRSAARSVGCLGGGADLVTAEADRCAEEELAGIPGEVWRPMVGGPVHLRVPGGASAGHGGAPQAERHGLWCGPPRAPPGAETGWRRVGYGREGEAPCGRFACFVLRDPGGAKAASFDAARAGLAGMVRGAAHVAALRQGWATDDALRLFLGRGGVAPSARLTVLPLPTIQHPEEAGGPVVGPVQRVLVVSPADDAGTARWVERRLAGLVIRNTRTGRVRAVLDPAPHGDPVVQRYLAPASTWSTVTPIVLPGHEDDARVRERLLAEAHPVRRAEVQGRIDRRTATSIRKAIVRAGLEAGMAARAELSWQAEPYWRGGAPADRFAPPSHPPGLRVMHVRLRLRDEHGDPLAVPGPICLGRGVADGLGLFAAEG